MNKKVDFFELNYGENGLCPQPDSPDRSGINAKAFAPQVEKTCGRARRHL